MMNFDYSRPGTIEAAIELMSKNAGAQYIAGGTNLVDLMKRNVLAPHKIIDINSLPLQEIEAKTEGLYIGALVSNSEAAENQAIQKDFPLLAEALKAGASPQIRNMASIGGNILQRTRCPYFYDVAMPCNKRQPGSGCSALEGYNRYHAIFTDSNKCIAVHPSDFCVALAAFDTTVVVQGPKGRRQIPFQEFHRLPGNNPEKDNSLLPGELILGVEIVKPKFNQHTHYLKVRDRTSYAFALVAVAVLLEMDKDRILGARMAMGGVAHKPWRLFDAEKYLVGRLANKKSFSAAAAIAMKPAKGFGFNDFKLKMAPAAIVEALSKASKS
jgi:xanthine dehydrogenase YagS FAD-binding subunit